MTTDSPDGVKPEDLAAGFHELPERGFALVLPPAGQAKSAISFAGESVHHILDAKDKIKKLKAWESRGLTRQITLIGARHLASYAVPVLVDALFDAALAKTLAALGDSDFGVAVDALDEACEEPDPRSRCATGTPLRCTFAGRTRNTLTRSQSTRTPAARNSAPSPSRT